MPDTSVYISGATALVLIGYAIRATLKLTDIEAQLRADFIEQARLLQQDILRVEREDMSRSETMMREFGETCAALRHKIHDTETWNRDNFIRKESFQTVVERLEKAVDKLGDKVDATRNEVVKSLKGIEH